MRYVPKIEVREIIREFPRVDVQWFDRPVPVPQVQVVEKVVEIPEINEVVRHVEKVEIVDVPVERKVYVPKVAVETVERTRAIPVPQVVDVEVVPRPRGGARAPGAGRAAEGPGPPDGRRPCRRRGPAACGGGGALRPARACGSRALPPPRAPRREGRRVPVLVPIEQVEEVPREVPREPPPAPPPGLQPFGFGS